MMVIKIRTCFIVGNDEGVKIWTDRWCNDLSLEESFLMLFSIALAKDDWVAKVWEQVSEGGRWSPHFLRQFNDRGT